MLPCKIKRLSDEPLCKVWGAAVDALEAADGTTAGMVEGGFILRADCSSRVIKNKPLCKHHREKSKIELVDRHPVEKLRGPNFQIDRIHEC
jgi:predicted hydrolase (HD superfamily)